MFARARAILAIAMFVLGLGATGCKEQQGFMEPTKVREAFMDVDDQIVDGQRRLEFRVNVPSGVTHPSFEGLWTFRNPERPLFVYIVRASEYDSAADPDSLPNFYTTLCISTADPTACARALLRPEVTTIHVHPTPGDWVIVLHNPATFGPVTRTEVSGRIDLSYWR